MKNHNIPKLRYPEFTDAWEKCKVKEIFKVTRGNVLSTNELKEKSSDYPYPVYSSQTKNDGLLGFYNQYLYENAITWTTDGANAGTVKYRDKKFYCTNVCGVLTSANGYANEMVSEALNLIAYRFVSKVGNPKLMNNVMSEIEIYLPTLPEQQKIGNLFKQLDRLITLHKRKWDDVILLKKALLQKMFPKNGSDFPEIRFPEFTDAWEKCKLENFVEITTGKLDANAMVNDGKYDFYTSGIKKFKINIPAFTGPAITIAGNGATVGFMHLADGEFNAYQRTYVLTKFSNSIREFLFYEIGIKLPRKISAEARTGNIPYIVMDMLTNLDVFTPTVPEQQKIGNLFKQLDRLITLHKRQHEHYQLLKKALLQQMFV
ncbi:Type I restriction enzyme specificity protein MG438 [uncultured Avibacterium sp.]|uniref:Type I restriction enzyme specificity protein MG438 n=2 Tax=uncultured Avibacterium sp. TaxID=1936169 RepID=A0A486XEC1_9PAST|nr:Type I restriction enzyme specificity protein MG438 [uncultured Avibacterium sp.]